MSKNCIWAVKDRTLPLGCSIVLNYKLEIVGDEYVISIHNKDKFYVNLLFDRSIHRPTCTHMGYI